MLQRCWCRQHGQLGRALLVLALAAAVMHIMPVAAHPAHHDEFKSCGTSRTFRVSCVVDSDRVLDIRLENDDGSLSSVCNVGYPPNTFVMQYTLAPGDNIYGVQACYKDKTLVGVTFSAASGPKTCGKPSDPDAVCKSSVTTHPAPLAGMTGNCDSEGITHITRVCFNPLYVNKDIPITGCPPGQGRLDQQDPCKPCPRNFYNPGGLLGACLRCPSELVTITEGAARCGCPPGYGANPNSGVGKAACAPCAPGTYYPGGNVEPCWRCRGSAFLTSQPGSSSIVQCVCAPGFGASVSAPNTCQPCPKGTWSNGLADIIPQDPLNSIARFPAGVGNGKGKGGCYTCNPSWKECTSCCEDSTRECDKTTLVPGSTAQSACVPRPTAQALEGAGNGTLLGSSDSSSSSSSSSEGAVSIEGLKPTVITGGSVLSSGSTEEVAVAEGAVPAMWDNSTLLSSSQDIVTLADGLLETGLVAATGSSSHVQELASTQDAVSTDLLSSQQPVVLLEGLLPRSTDSISESSVNSSMSEADEVLTETASVADDTQLLSSQEQVVLLEGVSVENWRGDGTHQQQQ